MLRFKIGICFCIGVGLGIDVCLMVLGLIFRDKKLLVFSLDLMVFFKVCINKG